MKLRLVMKVFLSTVASKAPVRAYSLIWKNKKVVIYRREVGICLLFKTVFYVKSLLWRTIFYMKRYLFVLIQSEEK